MKKSLVMLVVLVGSLALAGSVFAMDWGCFGAMPTCKMPPCKDKVLCKGKAKGVEKLCGPCAPVIKWAGSWSTIEKCPAKPKAVKAAPKAKKGKKA
jgi:hypothetical protein